MRESSGLTPRLGPPATGRAERALQLDQLKAVEGGLAGRPSPHRRASLCGQGFLWVACNYRMAYLPSVVLSLIRSLELVPLVRHNMRGQMHTDSSAGSLAGQHLPPSSPRLLT